ncbi:aminopeptidase [Deltaproteobacteria bacterium]|nr:aminopeptidase [Deltaproteobacteria bacterium]
MTRPVRISLGLVFFGVLALGASSCGGSYIIKSGFHQAELLSKREPVEAVLAGGTLSAGEEQRLRLFAEVKAFGATLGLRSTHNYGTYARTWDRRIWNLAACPELSFSAKTWWFPIVGTVPYLGFFTDEDMNTWRVRLQREGLEVSVREVGAYSTLGWFRDPILPAMLRWDEPRIAETVSHELAHATLWIPGSVDFNESFASVVGEAAGDAFLVHKYGAESAEVQAARDGNHDWIVFQGLLAALYEELDAVYRDSTASDAEKRERKAALYASLDERVLASTLRQKPRWLQLVRTSTWNNPRLSQFHTYNSGEGDFARVLAECNGDIGCFIEQIRSITAGRRDPFTALHEAVARP